MRRFRVPQRHHHDLLWRGNAAYVLHYDVPIMFGCASFPGTDPQEHAQPLSYLYHNHLAPPALRPRARDEHYVNMDLIPRRSWTGGPRSGPCRR